MAKIGASIEDLPQWCDFWCPLLLLHSISLDVGGMSLFFYGRCLIEIYWAASLLPLILFILCRLFICDMWWYVVRLKFYRWYVVRLKLWAQRIWVHSLPPSFFRQLLELGCVLGTGLSSGGTTSKEDMVSGYKYIQSRGKRKGNNDHLGWSMGSQGEMSFTWWIGPTLGFCLLTSWRWPRTVWVS